MQAFKTVIVAMLFALTACATEDDNDKNQEGDGMIKQAMDAQLVPKQKARDLEQQLLDDFEKQKKEIDRQSGGDG